MVNKLTSSAIQELRAMFSEHGKPAEINADGEFDNRAFNRFLASQKLASRFWEGRQDLATVDAAMNNFKKMLKERMQEEDTTEWKELFPRAVRAHNKLERASLIGAGRAE